MQKCYLKYHRQVTIIRYLMIVFLAAHGLWLQSQNPFDIKSRKNIDTVQQKDSHPESVNPINLRNDSLVQFSEGMDSHFVDEPLMPFDKGNTLVEHDIEDTTSQDSLIDFSETTEAIRSKSTDEIISSSRQETANQLTDRIKIKDDIALSGTSDMKITWWYYVFDFILLLILLGAFLYDKNIFTPLRKAFVHENYLRFLYRDTYLRKPGLFFYLNVLFTLSLGFIIFRATQYFEWASTFRDYLIIQSIVLFLFTIKHIVLYLLARLVDKPFDVKFYQYWMILSAGIIGLWMIPIALMVSVLPAQYLYIAMIIITIPVTLALIYRQSKALIHAKYFLSKHFFQFILYFCAVEIVPVVLLADILIQN